MGCTSTMGCLDSSFDTVLVSSTRGRCCDFCSSDIVHVELLSDLAQGTTNEPRNDTRFVGADYGLRNARESTQCQTINVLIIKIQVASAPGFGIPKVQSVKVQDFWRISIEFAWIAYPEGQFSCSNVNPASS